MPTSYNLAEDAKKKLTKMWNLRRHLRKVGKEIKYIFNVTQNMLIKSLKLTITM
jgi:hypothetical protein